MSTYNYVQALQHADQEIVDIMQAPFLAALPQYIQDIESATASLDHDALRRHAHTLKGLAGNFCAEPVVQLSLQLELLGKQQQTASAAALISELRTELSALEQALSTV